MTLSEVIINLLLAILAFVVARYVGLLLTSSTPPNPERSRVIEIVAILIAVLVFFANFAATIRFK